MILLSFDTPLTTFKKISFPFKIHFIKKIYQKSFQDMINRYIRRLFSFYFKKFIKKSIYKTSSYNQKKIKLSLEIIFYSTFLFFMHQIAKYFFFCIPLEINKKGWFYTFWWLQMRLLLFAFSHYIFSLIYLVKKVAMKECPKSIHFCLLIDSTEAEMFNWNALSQKEPKL